MALAYNRSAGHAIDDVSICRLDGPVEETKNDGGPSELSVVKAAHTASDHPEGSMIDDVLDDNGAADPIAAEGVDADYGDGGDADDVDSDDAREPDYRPHGNRRCRYDWEVTWYPLVRQGIELAFWLKNAIRLDVKRIDLLDGGLISINSSRRATSTRIRQTATSRNMS
jgi:hypothetical protein